MSSVLPLSAWELVKPTMIDDEETLVTLHCYTCKATWESSKKGAKFAAKNCKKCREEQKANPHKPSGGSNWSWGGPKVEIQPEIKLTPEQLAKIEDIRKMFTDKSTTDEW